MGGRLFVKERCRNFRSKIYHEICIIWILLWGWRFFYHKDIIIFTLKKAVNAGSDKQLIMHEFSNISHNSRINLRKKLDRFQKNFDFCGFEGFKDWGFKNYWNFKSVITGGYDVSIFEIAREINGQIILLQDSPKNILNRLSNSNRFKHKDLIVFISK